MKNLKKRVFGYLLAFSVILGAALAFVPNETHAQSGFFAKLKKATENSDKIPCHSSATVVEDREYTACATCKIRAGIGSDSATCKPS